MAHTLNVPYAHLVQYAIFGAVRKLLVMTCGIQFPDWGSNLGPLHGGAWILSHWTTREVLRDSYFY